MKIRSIPGWTVGILIVLICSAVKGLAFQAGPALHPTFGAPIPEDPTLVLAILGGAGVAWQYFRSRARK